MVGRVGSERKPEKGGREWMQPREREEGRGLRRPARRHRSVAPSLPRHRHIIVMQEADVDVCPELGAITRGVETCCLGAIICGAEPLGPKSQIISLEIQMKNSFTRRDKKQKVLFTE